MIPPEVTALMSGAAGMQSGVLGLLGQFITNRQNQKLANQAYQHDLDMWQRQNQQNYLMWNLQNEYNTPAQQMQRYQNAGLNPNLIYSQGNPGNAAQIGQAQQPKYNAPDYQMPLNKFFNMAGILDQYMDLTIKQKQAKNMDEQNKLISAQTLNTLAGHGLREQKIQQQHGLYPIQLEYATARNIKQKQEIDELANRVKLSNLLFEENKYNYEHYTRLGTRSNDPFYVRWVGEIADEIFKFFHEVLGGDNTLVGRWFTPRSKRYSLPLND